MDFFMGWFANLAGWLAGLAGLAGWLAGNWLLTAGTDRRDRQQAAETAKADSRDRLPAVSSVLTAGSRDSWRGRPGSANSLHGVRQPAFCRQSRNASGQTDPPYHSR